MKRLLSTVYLLAALPTAAAPKITPDAQAKLDAHGLVVVDQPLRQGFSAYLGSERPLFISSDSLLMAYHRIFEEMVGEIEVGQLVVFQDFTRELWKNLPADAGKDADDATKEGLRRARLITATASRLLTGSLPEGLSETETAAVTAEVGRVEKGEGIAPPAWILADPKPEDHVSYAAFQSGGLYEGRETLERYYRFRKWLQEMQVDPADKSTTAMLGCLGIAVANMDEDDKVGGIHSTLESPFAPGDFEPGLLNRLPGICGRMGNSEIPEVAERIYNGIAIMQRHRLFGVLHPGGSKITRALMERSAPGATPGAVGLALGNRFASSLLDPPLAEATTLCGDFILSDELDLRDIRHYHDALRALNAPPDDRAPPLFRSEPWQRKQLNATLGSWTEYRYALLLGSREDAHWIGMVRQDPGFVEPIPEFYRQLGESAEFLVSRHRGYRTKRAAHAAWLLRLQDAGSLLRRIHEASQKGETISPEIEDKARVHVRLLYKLFPDLQPFGWGYPPPLPAKANCAKMAERIDALAESWWNEDPQAGAQLEATREVAPDTVGPRLSRLAGICFRLETMAERQLAKRPWTEADKAFFNDYGATLGWLMFYEGNSYITPRDDAPRIIRYASLSNGSTAHIFHAATSQPRLLLIRYPNPEGKDILCQGAVYAYRDVERDRTPAKQQWQAEAKASAWPEWMKPIVGSYEPTAEKKE